MEIMPTSVRIKFTIRRRGQTIRSENLLRKGARTELPYSWLKLAMDLLTRSFLMRRRQDRHISPTLIGAVFVQSWKLATVWVGQLIPLIILQPGPISLFSPHWSGEEPGDPDRKYATDTFSIISKYPFKRRLRQIFKHIQRRSKTLQDEGLQKTVNFLINKYPLYIITWVMFFGWVCQNQCKEWDSNLQVLENKIDPGTAQYCNRRQGDDFLTSGDRICFGVKLTLPISPVVTWGSIHLLLTSFEDSWNLCHTSRFCTNKRSVFNRFTPILP